MHVHCFCLCVHAYMHVHASMPACIEANFQRNIFIILIFQISFAILALLPFSTVVNNLKANIEISHNANFLSS